MPARQSAAALAGSTVDDLRSQLRGTLIRREDADYDAARVVYNAMIDKHPGSLLAAWTSQT